MPHNLLPWAAVYQQVQRWLATGCSDALADDPRAVLSLAHGRNAEPSAAVLNSRTLRSSPKPGEQAGCDGAKRKRGSKLHMATDTLGTYWRCMSPRPAPIAGPRSTDWPKSCRRLRAERGTGLCGPGLHEWSSAEAAQAHGITLEVVELPEAKKGFVHLPRCWMVERSFAWAARFRHLVKDYERYASTLAEMHRIAALVVVAIRDDPVGHDARGGRERKLGLCFSIATRIRVLARFACKVDRGFTASGPNQLWVTDIAYVPMATGLLQLAVVVDAWSRKPEAKRPSEVVGCSMANHLRTELVLDALEMAVGQRQPTDPRRADRSGRARLYRIGPPTLIRSGPPAFGRAGHAKGRTASNAQGAWNQVVPALSKPLRRRRSEV